jgi:hypothetical protein
MTLELKTTDVRPVTLWQGQILCDDDGVPFAVVADRPGLCTSGAVLVPTRSIPEGSFDVRTFSRDHKYMRTQGCAGIVTWPTYAHAYAYQHRAMAHRTREEIDVWGQYSAIYYADTVRPARLSEFGPGLSVEFPTGTTAKVVTW